jgi:hypothetical protein
VRHADTQLAEVDLPRIDAIVLTDIQSGTADGQEETYDEPSEGRTN